MAADSEVFDAARTALAIWLTARLTPAYPSLVVWDDWPDSGQQIPEYALTVLAAGDPDVEYYQPVDVKVTPGASPSGVVLYQYGWANELPLQIDVFATSSTARDALLRDTVAQLNVAPGISLAGTPHDPQALPDFATRPGLALVMPDRFETLCFYAFQPTASSTQTSSQAQTDEWRATLRGQAQCALLAEETMPLVKRLTLTDSNTGDTLVDKTAP